MKTLFTYAFLVLVLSSFGQTLTDVDGNIYNTIKIGTQTWMQESLKSLHYADGSDIVETTFFPDVENYVENYGRLYNWGAAMNGSTDPGAQGACPDGWHIPQKTEWETLITELGGDGVAGGALKETGNDYWADGNVGATNSSGFAARGAGEKAGSAQNWQFQFFNEAVLFWSSNQSGSLTAYYYGASSNNDNALQINYYKDYYYSVRCIENETVGIDETEKMEFRAYPNPANDYVKFFLTNDYENITIELYNTLGVLQKINCRIEKLEIQINGKNLSSGCYFLIIKSGQSVISSGTIIFE